MGNIHIFIPDGLHERLRKVCRHKVTQQKFLEEGIEKLVSEKEGHPVLCTDKKLADVEEVKALDVREKGYTERLFDLARERVKEALELEGEEVAVEGVAISPQYYDEYFPEGEE